MIKQSAYNIFLECEGGNYIVYNTLANSMAAIGKKLKDSLEKFDESSCIDSKIIEDLKKLGVLIDDYIDEKKIIKYEYENAKYNSDFSIFTILTTYACNLGCPYCYEGKGEILNASMSEEIIDLVTKFIKKETSRNHGKPLHIVLFGGEPLLNSTACFNLLDKIQPWAKKNKVPLSIEISTNGTLFTKEMIERFSKYEHVTTHIPLHGPKEIHDKKRCYKNGSGTFEVIMSALTLLKNSPISPFILINLDKESIGRISELLEDLKRKNLNDIPIAFECISPLTVDACQGYSSEYFLRTDASAVSKLYDLIRAKNFRTPVRRAHRYLYCEVLAKDTYCIDSLRNVYKCWHLVGQKEHRVGVIDEKGDFKPTYEYYDILSRDPLQIKECRDCKILPLCGGGCPERAYSRYNTYHAPGCLGKSIDIKKMIKRYLMRHHPSVFKKQKGGEKHVVKNS